MRHPNDCWTGGRKGALSNLICVADSIKKIVSVEITRKWNKLTQLFKGDYLLDPTTLGKPTKVRDGDVGSKTLDHVGEDLFQKHSTFSSFARGYVKIDIDVLRS
jgi:hypothetical protein